jgi:NAD(P)-dependent dehydrogenase (short-subunit alcohol dehydrogenase family)
LGRSIALELARQGVNIVLTDIARVTAQLPSHEREIGWAGIDSVAAEVEAAGASALALVSDVGDPHAAEALVAAAMERFGTIDFLVNNAGAAVAGDCAVVTELPVEDWDRVMRVNLNGTFLMSRAVARILVERGQGGAIINISSVAARQAPKGSAAYAVSKAGVAALARVMAMELAPHGIRVNAVMPGLTVTARLGDRPDQEGWDSFVKNYVPLGVASGGADVAWMCTYLCSDMGKWITGQDIAVDGGSTWH